MRKEVGRMKRYGLMGIVGVLLLVMAATPAMAAEVNNVTVNASGLYLFDFSYSYVSPGVFSFTGTFNNTNSTELTGTVWLYVNGMKVLNNTSVTCLLYTSPSPRD